ncbi:MAG: hypothetical protein Q9157_002376 [Trypethelium eluteriae]
MAIELLLGEDIAAVLVARCQLSNGGLVFLGYRDEPCALAWRAPGAPGRDRPLVLVMQ